MAELSFIEKGGGLPSDDEMKMIEEFITEKLLLKNDLPLDVEYGYDIYCIAEGALFLMVKACDHEGSTENIGTVSYFREDIQGGMITYCPVLNTIKDKRDSLAKGRH